MSGSFKFVALASLVLFAAACAREPEPVVVQPPPVAPEPVYNKY